MLPLCLFLEHPERDVPPPAISSSPFFCQSGEHLLLDDRRGKHAMFPIKYQPCCSTARVPLAERLCGGCTLSPTKFAVVNTDVPALVKTDYIP